MRSCVTKQCGCKGETPRRVRAPVCTRTPLAGPSAALTRRPWSHGPPQPRKGAGPRASPWLAFASPQVTPTLRGGSQGDRPPLRVSRVRPWLGGRVPFAALSLWPLSLPTPQPLGVATVTLPGRWLQTRRPSLPTAEDQARVASCSARHRSCCSWRGPAHLPRLRQPVPGLSRSEHGTPLTSDLRRASFWPCPLSLSLLPRCRLGSHSRAPWLTSTVRPWLAMLHQDHRLAHLHLCPPAIAGCSPRGASRKPRPPLGCCPVVSQGSWRAEVRGHRTDEAWVPAWGVERG